MSSAVIARRAYGLSVIAVVLCLTVQAVAESFCASTRIVGGEEAAPDSWPSQAAVLRSDGGLCGGTVIAPNWVLTAAHCVFADHDGTNLLPASAFQVVTKTKNFREGGERIPVRQVVTEKDYHGSEFGHDLALLQLDRPTSVPAIGLMSEELIPKLAPPGTSAIVVGWGTTKPEGDVAQSLMQVALPIVGFDTCKKSYDLVSTQICAGFPEGGKDSCQGDSGGPLMVRDANGKFAQVGVVSYGKGCAEAGFPGVYEEPGPHLSWIRQHVREVVVAGAPATTPNGDQGVVAAVDDLAAGASGQQVHLAMLPQNRVKRGSTIRLVVDSAMTGNLLLIDARETGELVQLFPNRFKSPYASGYVTAGKPRVLPGSGDGFEVVADAAGRGRVLAIVSKDLIRIEGLAQRHLDLEPIPDPRRHLGALCDGLRSARIEHAGDWNMAMQEYEITP